VAGPGSRTLPTFLELLDGRHGSGGWQFTIPRALHGAFGGAFGGVVAAACVAAARSCAEDRTPMALDCRFLRSLPAGTAWFTTTTLATGRSLTNVAVDVIGPDDRLCTRATLSLAAPEALTDEVDTPSAPLDAPSYDDATPWREPPGVEIPIVTTLAPRGARVDGGFASVLAVPWEPDSGRSAEAACVAADISVGPPVAAAVADRWIPHPNPDLSLRFGGPVATHEVCGIGRLRCIRDGLAAVTIEVTASGHLVAVGISTSMLLRAPVEA
jgi:acyl-coenzyme A thioesterase PaaI-like protein